MAAMGKTFENEEPNRRGAFISWRWLAIASFLIIALPVGILIANKLRGSDVDRGTRALIEAFSKQRVIEPRLSGGFKGGEFRPSREDLSGVKADEFEQARELITDAAAKGKPHAQLAYARLLLSKGEKLPEALRYLRLELANSPESVQAHNDLGVCFILQGKLEDAIDEFEVALKHRADMPEALFNRALCYEQLLLRDAASTEYSRVLTIEREPGWLNEINDRQKRMSSPLAPQKKETGIVAAFDEAARSGSIEAAERIADDNLEIMFRHAYRDCPVEYLKESLGGDFSRAQRPLDEIDLIGRRFGKARGDFLLADLASYLRNLQQRRWQAELGLFSDYLAAEVLLASQSFSQAQREFQRLSERFAANGNEMFQHFSLLCSASCQYATGSLAAGLVTLRKSLSIVENHSWPSQRALVLMQVGSNYSRVGQDSLAIKYCEQALEYGGEGQLLEAKVLQYLNEAYADLGDLDNGLECLRRSTSLYLSSVPTFKEIASNYLDIAELQRLRGKHSLALLYAMEAIRFADQAKDNNRAAQAASFVAVELGQLNQAVNAGLELKRALEYLEKTEPGQRVFTEPLVLSRAGVLALTLGNTTRAVECYSKAEILAEKGEGKTIPLIRVLRGRAGAHEQAKEFDKARLDLQRAIGLIEGYRAGIGERKNRRTFLDARQSVFDQMIQLNVDAFGRWEKAFDISEEARARDLLDESSEARTTTRQNDSHSSQRNAADNLTSGKRRRPVKLAEVQAALPDDLRVLAYSVTNERTYLFLITHNGFEVAESAATSELLDRLVHDYVASLKSKAPLEEVFERGKKLYEYLIKPVERWLGDGKALCIAPDKVLHFLPFAALVDGSGEYLINSYRLTYAPSASVLVRSIHEARVKGKSKNEKILAVGNPQFDRAAFPMLANLEDAEREASESAAAYPKSLILKGADATEVQVRAALEDCDVAHLAVHCLVEEKSPWLAALVLAKQGVGVGGQGLGSGSESSPDDGMLYLNEVYEISLSRTRLVVLSACQSGLGQYYRGEGIVSLIHPFLALRVPTVVASLWSVDSQATAALMIDFHRERTTTNRGAGDALRAAQIKMTRDVRYGHPYYWAPFIAVGCNS